MRYFDTAVIRFAIGVGLVLGMGIVIFGLLVNVMEYWRYLRVGLDVISLGLGVAFVWRFREWIGEQGSYSVILSRYGQYMYWTILVLLVWFVLISELVMGSAGEELIQAWVAEQFDLQAKVLNEGLIRELTGWVLAAVRILVTGAIPVVFWKWFSGTKKKK